MTDWDDILETDAAAFSELGEETITYRKASGTTRSIGAIIDREPNEMPAGGQIGLIAGPEISVENSLTTGVTPGELDVGSDQFLLAAKKGGTATYFRVAMVLSQDAGRMRIKLKSR